MANIGRVYKSSYQKGAQTIDTIVLDIRTITVMKQFTISVNKLKYPDGNINSTAVRGKEEHPDYHIWASLAKRGESGMSEIVGSIKNAVSENGLKYKRASLFDPFVSDKSIYFTLFAVDNEKKKDENHLYNVVAQPYRNPNNDNSTQQAQPSYNAPQQNASYGTSNNAQENVQTPVEIDIDGDEIPF